MKYLKKFNENNIDLQTYCNDYLVYLIDLGFKIDVNTTHTGFSRISIYNGKVSNTFNWNDVKDYIIPFITMLNDEKGIDEIYFKFFDSMMKFNKYIENENLQRRNISHIINNTYNATEQINYIAIFLN